MVGYFISRFSGEPQMTLSAFFTQLTAMLRPLLPRYESEGKSYLTVALGCTGGQHRSVAIAEAIAESLRRVGHDPSVQHRDVDKASLIG